MSVEEIKGKVVACVRSHYETRKLAPSIGLLCQETGLSRKEIYGAFPSGQSEICEASGIPVPQDRIERTRKATERRVRKAERLAHKKGEGGRAEAQTSPLDEHRLTKEQVDRFYGLLHLEPGRKDIRSIIDTWLDMDVQLRVRYGMKSVDEIGEAVKLARKVADMGTDLNRLLDAATSLERADVALEPDQLETLARFLRDMIDGGWEAKEIADYVTILDNCGVAKSIGPKEFDVLFGVFLEARKTGVAPSKHIQALREEGDKLKNEVEGLRAERERLTKDVGELERKREEAAQRLAKVGTSGRTQTAPSDVKAVEKTSEAGKEFDEELKKWLHDLLYPEPEKRAKNQGWSRIKKKTQEAATG